MKKVTSLFLAIALILTMFAIPANAATTTVSTPTIWNGKVSTNWYTGKKNTYNISTASQLAGLAKLVNSGESMTGITINLTADIKLNDTSNLANWSTKAPKNKWTPIGKSGNPVSGYFPFAGAFNGNGHTIEGIYVSGVTTAGLFGYLYGGIVTGVTIKNGYISANQETSSKSTYAGGISGIAEKSIINECENNATIYSQCGGKKDLGGMLTSYAGGIVGSVHQENMAEEFLFVAFLGAGFMVNPLLTAGMKDGYITSTRISNCLNSGIIKAVASGITMPCVGGIAGRMVSGTITRVLNVGGVNFSRSDGGRFGTYGGKTAGGIIGEFTNVTMSRCYYYTTSTKWKGVGKLVYNMNSDKYTDNSQGITDKIVVSTKLVDALGDSFVYVKGSFPKVVATV